MFLDALAAFSELTGTAAGDERSFQVALEAPDRPALLARWLEELIFLAEAEGFVPADADISLVSNRLDGRSTAASASRRRSSRP